MTTMAKDESGSGLHFLPTISGSVSLTDNLSVSALLGYNGSLGDFFKDDKGVSAAGEVLASVTFSFKI